MSPKLLLTFLLLTAPAMAAMAQEPAAEKPPEKPAEAPKKVESKPEEKASEAIGKIKGSIVLVTKAVGEVGDRVITSREVRISDAVEQALTEKPPSPEGFRVLGGQERAFPGEVSQVLDEWVVYLEARALSSQPPTKADVASAMKLVTDFWASKTGWGVLEVGNEELRDMLERKLIAREFERLKSDPQLAPVSDDEALAYYRKNRLRFGSLPFSAFKENIKAFLVKQQTERRLAEWREVLRRKYRVRNFIAG